MTQYRPNLHHRTHQKKPRRSNIMLLECSSSSRLRVVIQVPAPCLWLTHNYRFGTDQRCRHDEDFKAKHLGSLVCSSGGEPFIPRIRGPLDRNEAMKRRQIYHILTSYKILTGQFSKTSTSRTRSETAHNTTRVLQIPQVFFQIKGTKLSFSNIVAIHCNTYT